jgi:CDGSH-type Zn-finger protein
MSDNMKIKIIENGPYMVHGAVPLKEETIKVDAMGKADKWVETKKYYPDGIYMLCRCGKSTDKPFCTGSHTDFDGTETARRNAFEEGADVFKGAEGVELLQDPRLCIGAGFCHGRYHVEDTIKKEKTLNIALQQTYDCLGGSLLIKINGEPQEPKLEKSISASNTASKKGPLLVKGGIPVESSDGQKYEVRNRVALCNCGKSSYKPFCDGTHLR